jgi:hypothetical protein
MYSDSAKVSASLYAFTSVDPGAQLETESPNRFGRGHGALHGPGWAVERGEEPVSGCLDLPAAEQVELAAHDLVMVVEKVTPAVIAQVNSASGGVDNVGEQDSGQDSVGIGRGAMPGQKFLIVVEGPGLVLANRQVIPAWQLEVTGICDMLGEITAVLH